MIRLLFILLLILSCQQPEDCAGVADGGAYLDECEQCVGGTTGLIENYLKDCAGVCNGGAVEDCAGQCGGTAVEDCMGYCNGVFLIDCAGDCDGNSYEDDCGNCDNITSNDCILGCMESDACNYSEHATDSNDSCVYANAEYDCDCYDSFGGNICDDPGCMEPDACNYDVTATETDDSCLYPEDFGWCDCDQNILDCLGECGGVADGYDCYPIGTWKAEWYGFHEGDCDSFVFDESNITYYPLDDDDSFWPEHYPITIYDSELSYTEYAISANTENQLYGYSGSYTFNSQTNIGCVTTDEYITIPIPELNQDCLSNFIFSDDSGVSLTSSLGDNDIHCEPEVDVCLSLQDQEIHYVSTSVIAGYQFTHSGCVITAGGGDSEENGLGITLGETAMIVFGASGQSIPAGSGILLNLNICTDGWVDDCDGSGQCCEEEWIGDGWADCEDQAYGCDLSCHENDGGDCDSTEPNPVETSCYDYEITDSSMSLKTTIVFEGFDESFELEDTYCLEKYYSKISDDPTRLINGESDNFRRSPRMTTNSIIKQAFKEQR